jgi:hypothetical protein
MTANPGELISKFIELQLGYILSVGKTLFPQCWQYLGVMLFDVGFASS